jgi:hypothetical protein
MSLVSRIKDWFIGSPDADDAKPRSKDPPSRHDRRAAGRERHHKTGAPSWDSSDKVGGGGSGPSSNPDAAPEILGR